MLPTWSIRILFIPPFWTIFARRIESSRNPESWRSTMSTTSADKNFAGSIPAVYDTYLVPLIFEEYAADLTGRLASFSPERVLEVAAGTGVVTRAMTATLPASVSIVATDLNQAMLDRAA